MLLTFTLEIDGEFVDPDGNSVWFDDDGGVYGVRRVDTEAIIVPSMTPMVRQDVGVYTYNLVEPDPELQYEYTVNWVLDGAPQSQYRLVGSGTGGGDDPTPVTGRYTSSLRLYAKFGRSNVQAWGKFDDEESAGDVQDRIAYCINIAEQYVDDALRTCRLVVPFVTTIPETIRDIATILAGVELYEARGMEDTEDGEANHRLASHRQRAYRKINDIKTGALDLGLSRPFFTQVPQVAEDWVSPTGNPVIFTDFDIQLP